MLALHVNHLTKLRGQEIFCPLGCQKSIRVATETANSNAELSRTVLGHFPGLFQDCLSLFFFTGLEI